MPRPRESAPTRRVGALTAVLLGLLVIGAPAVASGEAPGRIVAVTIDDLPMAGERWSGGDLATVRQVNELTLKALTAHGVPAIGFVNERDLQVSGEMDGRVEVLRGWLEAGMELGNHTYSHLSLQTTPLREYQDDVLHGEVITRRLLEERGERIRFFRYPFNHTGPDAETKAEFQEFLTERGYRIAPFTVEHGDYVFDTAYSRALASGDEELAGRVREAYLEHVDVMFDYAESLSADTLGREIPQIFLIHVNRLNADSLDAMLSRIEARGYAFAPLAQVLEDPAYAAEERYVGRWGISWLHRWRASRGLPRRTDEPDPPPFVLDEYRAASAD